LARLMSPLLPETITTAVDVFSVESHNSDGEESLDCLPWKPIARGSKPRKSSHAMWMSAPNLNFGGSEADDGNNSFQFDEPDFSESFRVVEDDPSMRRNPLLDESPLRSPSIKSSVKVRASLLKNMSEKEREIKSLFTQWKSDNKKKNIAPNSNLQLDNFQVNSPHDDDGFPQFSIPRASPPEKNRNKKIRSLSASSPDFNFDIKDLFDPHYDLDKDDASFSPFPSAASGKKKNTKKIRSLSASSPDLKFNAREAFGSQADIDKIYAHAPSSPIKTAKASLSPRKKKKIAVKLKASDLNLSDEKKKEIEDLFWQWKGKLKDPNSPDIVKEGKVDRRWKIEAEQKAASRPKPAARQRSASLEPTPELCQKSLKNTERKVSLRESSSETLDMVAEVAEKPEGNTREKTRRGRSSEPRPSRKSGASERLSTGNCRDTMRSRSISQDSENNNNHNNEKSRVWCKSRSGYKQRSNNTEPLEPIEKVVVRSSNSKIHDEDRAPPRRSVSQSRDALKARNRSRSISKGRDGISSGSSVGSRNYDDDKSSRRSCSKCRKEEVAVLRESSSQDRDLNKELNGRLVRDRQLSKAGSS
jgi:hypothetical protein